MSFPKLPGKTCSRNHWVSNNNAVLAEAWNVSASKLAMITAQKAGPRNLWILFDVKMNTLPALLFRPYTEEVSFPSPWQE